MNINTIIFGLDIESSGPCVIENEIIAIGYFICDSDGNQLLKKRLCLTFDRNSFDDECVENFWSKDDNVKKLKEFNKESIPPSVAMKIFYDDYCYWNKIYNIILVSDNQLLDFSMINVYLKKYLGVKPLHLFDKFRPIHDLKSYLRGLCKDRAIPITCHNVSVQHYCNILGIKTRDIVHDHYPDNDAEYVALVYHRAIQKCFE